MVLRQPPNVIFCQFRFLETECSEGVGVFQCIQWCEDDVCATEQLLRQRAPTLMMKALSLEGLTLSIGVWVCWTTMSCFLRIRYRSTSSYLDRFTIKLFCSFRYLSSPVQYKYALV